MKPLTFKLSPHRVLIYWALTAGFLAGSLGMFLSIFWIPYRNLTMQGCPSACTYDTDCNIPGCGTSTDAAKTQIRADQEPQIDRNKAQVNCLKGKCRMSGGHKHFFGAALVFLLALFGVGIAGIALYKGSMFLKIDDEGIHYHRLHSDIKIPWDGFLGLTYHGVNTRLGKDATVYSLSGDTGLLSFIVPGLPKGTSTRDLELGAFFFLQLTEAERDQLVVAIKEKTDTEPEPEYEW